MAFRMWVPSSGRWLCLVLLLWHADGTMRFDCDDGKLLVERDLLPQKQISCPGPPWTESSQKLSSIDTEYLSQPAQTVCMAVPIVYNQTIPNSGAHRPLGAESGEYLFCPPQRWLHNLQHGSVAFLYHPCAPVSQRAGLSALARSCLSHYIVTPFPQLSRLRPLALVAWGRTLELSHVTASEACDWLGRNALGSFQSAERHRGGRYSLLLTRAMDSQGLKDPVLGQAAQKPSSLGRQSLRQCCEGILSAFSEPEPGMRKRREVRDPTMGPQGEGTRGGSQVPGLPNAPPSNATQGASGVPRHDPHGTEAPKTTMAGQETDSRKGGPDTVNTEGELKPRAKDECRSRDQDWPGWGRGRETQPEQSVGVCGPRALRARRGGGCHARTETAHPTHGRGGVGGRGAGLPPGAAGAVCAAYPAVPKLAKSSQLVLARPDPGLRLRGRRDPQEAEVIGPEEEENHAEPQAGVRPSAQLQFVRGERLTVSLWRDTL